MGVRTYVRGIPVKAKTIKRLQIAVAIPLAILIFLFACAAFLLVASVTVDRDARVLPSYARVDISAILEKETWTDEDYNTVSYQTGIFSRETIDKLSARELLVFQDALFFKGELMHDDVAFTTPHDMLYDPETKDTYTAPIVPLEAGDILVTSTCHTFGWRNGHAALVLGKEQLLQSFTLGSDSDTCSLNSNNGVPWFRKATNFMVLRLKDADAETRRAIADKAEEELLDIPYSLVVGIFKKKDQGTAPKGTNCSHLVWQAYKNAGYDIDFDGGPVVTCRDIANSPHLEIVQIYGFDPVKGW